MKQFLTIALAVFVGLLGAMSVYYLVFTRPGVVDEFARVDRARQSAQQVGHELERAADSSVARVRAAFDSQAAEYQRRSLVAAAFAAAQSAKLAVTESYMTMGQWPASSAEVGWAEPSAYANDGARGVAIEAGGVIRVDLVEALAPRATLRLIPTEVPGSGEVKWRCEIAGYAELSRLVPTCKTAAEEPVAALIGEESTGAVPATTR